MDFKAFCLLRCAALLTYCFLTSVSYEIPHLMSASSGASDTLAATAVRAMTKTSPMLVRDVPTPASQVTRETVFSESVAPVQTTSTGTTESGSILPGASSITPHTCTDSAFHVGSFVGGVVATVATMLAVFLGYKLSCSRQEVQYRTIQEEHDAVI
ncbi:hypothetical protein SKAU_G00086610 [Synaphobranchus kaupii]|uniref:Transmembrane protein n=1 Tax=Synaphobranchus kaupii TaxID=118154 RepID=A0A9Q1FVP6_SYNKA|nr:hypothetical protein SKAU_G00086610 [Synaphobranchus kaupii]